MRTQQYPDPGKAPRRRPHGRRLLPLLAAAALAVVPVLFAASGPARADGPSLTVTPNSDLAGGQPVTVTGSGLPANYTFTIQQCAPAVGCDPYTGVSASTDETGTLAAATLTVHRVIAVPDPAGVRGLDRVACAGWGAYPCDIELSGAGPAPVAAAVITLQDTGAPPLTVTPASGLSDGQQVAVSAADLIPDYYWDLQQCAPAVGCDPSNSVPAYSDPANAMASTAFTVHRTITVDSGGTTVTVDCAVTACDIEATGAGPSPGGPAGAISFARPGYAFRGFLPPIANPPALNTARAGRTYPVKWQLLDSSGSYVSSLSAVTGITYRHNDCDAFSGDPANSVTTTATGGTSLRYDTAANQYVYNWAAPGTGCYTLFVSLGDGSTHAAYFKFG